MSVFLKWYFWHKNLWDEILLLGLINYIAANYSFEELTIMAQDENRLEEWLMTNKEFLSVWNMQFSVSWLSSSLPFSSTLLLWWWEVLTPQRRFPYNWWNYFRWFWPWVRGSLYFFGWIWTPNSFLTTVLYKLLLSRAKKIVLREKYSLEVAKKFNDKVVLHNDFAYDVVKIFLNYNSLPEKKWNYVLVNANPYVDFTLFEAGLQEFIQKHPDAEVYFVACDIHEDYPLYEEVRKKYPNIKYFDWTMYSLNQILSFFTEASAAYWIRLHFLLLCEWLNVPYTYIVYQEKVRKLLP